MNIFNRINNIFEDFRRVKSLKIAIETAYIMLGRGNYSTAEQHLRQALHILTNPNNKEKY